MTAALAWSSPARSGCGALCPRASSCARAACGLPAASCCLAARRRRKEEAARPGAGGTRRGGGGAVAREERAGRREARPLGEGGLRGLSGRSSFGGPTTAACTSSGAKQKCHSSNVIGKKAVAPRSGSCSRSVCWAYCLKLARDCAAASPAASKTEFERACISRTSSSTGSSGTAQPSSAPRRRGLLSTESSARKRAVVVSRTSSSQKRTRKEGRQKSPLSSRTWAGRKEPSVGGGGARPCRTVSKVEGGHCRLEHSVVARTRS